MDSGKVNSKLIRVALITAPLIALFTLTPALFRQSNGLNAPAPPFGIFPRLLFLTLFILLLWAMNIGLFHFFRKRAQQIKYPRFWRYAVSFLLCFVLVALLMYLPPPPEIRQAPSASPSKMLIPLIGILANNTMLLIILDLVILRGKQERMEKKISELVLNNLIAQNEQLKGQIHPHFLFNSLSTLKTLMKTSQEDAEKYLINLSGYLRAAITYSGEDVADLKEELNYCAEYLEMQKVRFGAALIYKVDIDSETQNSYSLPVFCIQQLVENAIKHNRMTKESPLVINIFIEGEDLVVKNNLNKKQNSSSIGSGLDNLAKRVRLLTESKKEIRIHQTKDEFYVTIPLLQYENSNH